MFKTDYDKVVSAAVTKTRMLQNDPLGYFVLSVLAGAYIGIGVLLAFTVGGLLQGAIYTKVLMGLSFGVALSLVVMAGAELFTGNNMALSMGIFSKEIKISDAVKLWCVCWLGNLTGAVILSLLYHFTGLASGDVGSFMAASAAAKISLEPVPLFVRGILCNFLVCLAVWSAGRATSDFGKLMMIIWCLFAFIVTGFEHSIANMTLLAVALLDPTEQAVSLWGCMYNLLVVTAGNMIGGIFFVALPYRIASRKD